jgi:hypothetical protein
LDDQLWVLNRPAIDEPIATGTFGVLEFDDVRAYPRGGSTRPDVLIPAEAWALELEGSDYLSQSTALDEQRDAQSLVRPNSGYAGGYGGQGQNLNAVTIITQTGTNKIITGFPGNGLPTPKP